MSIDNSTCVTSYTVTDASTRTYELGFTMREESTVAITRKRNGVATIIDADYYDLDADKTKVTLSTKADIAEGDTLIISRITPDTQQAIFTEGDKLPAKTIEYALDRAVMRCAELAKQIEDARQELADIQALIDETTNSGGIAPSTASATRLGMVKIGDNLSVTSDGTLSAQKQTLSVATSSTIGGIILGAGMTTLGGQLCVSKLYTANTIYSDRVLISSSTSNNASYLGEWVNLANLCSKTSSTGTLQTLSLSPSVRVTHRRVTTTESAKVVQLSYTPKSSDNSGAYQYIILDIDENTTVSAYNENLTIVDPITPNKMNHCIVLLSSQHAYVYVFAVTDRTEDD